MPYLAYVANLKLMFLDLPTQELEIIVNDRLDFDQAVEVVLHRFGHKISPNRDITRSVSSIEAEDNSNQDLFSGKETKFL